MEGPAQLLTLAPVMWGGLECSVKQVQYMLRQSKANVHACMLLPLVQPVIAIFTPAIGSPDVDCGDPGTPTNGQRSLSGTTYNSVVTYTCDVGYTLQGSNSRTCQPDGQWSGSVPQCNGMFGEISVGREFTS